MTRKVTASPSVKAQLERQGVDAMSSDPEVVRETMVRYIAKWSALVKAAGISID